MIAVGIVIAKVSAVIGLLGAIVFAFSDSATAASIAAVGTIAAALIGCLNTWLQTIVLKRTSEQAERLGMIHSTARDSATAMRQATGTERRKIDR